MSVENHTNPFRHNIGIKGDNINLLLTLKDNDLFEEIQIGDIITTPFTKILLSKKILCKVATVKDLKIPICSGQNIFVHTQSIKIASVITKVNNLIDRKTGNIVNKKVRHIGQDKCGLITIKVKNKKLDVFCLDEESKFKDLSRVTLRRDGETIALGLVNKLL